ncbi:MAG: epoxyqueuosine reductase QueH [Helicobacter sp.]|nr:epoxyqueuosine reductase QueH [Helicobacter sp.]
MSEILPYVNFTLVHICCSVDSHHFLLELQKNYPDKQFCGFFYNPNIHPYEEYQIRLSDVKRSCEQLGVPLYEGEYDIQSWFEGAKGLEEEPEKGERCGFCFDYRLERSAKMAQSLGCNAFTSTLLASPMKNQKELFRRGFEIAKQYHLDFLALDVRSGNGVELQNKRAKEAKLYRQNYCGCLFALKKQRQKSDKIPYELFSSLNLPKAERNLPKWRDKAFQSRNLLESQNKPYALVKRKVLCYRLLKGLLCDTKGQTIPSFILDYSYLKKPIKAKVECWQEGVGYADKEGIVFLVFETFKETIQKPTFKELLQEGLEEDLQINLRNQIYSKGFFVSPVIVVQEAFLGEFRLEICYQIQEEFLEDFIPKG